MEHTHTTECDCCSSASCPFLKHWIASSKHSLKVSQMISYRQWTWSTRTRRKQLSRLVTFSNLVPVVKLQLYKLACQQQAAQFEAASNNIQESSILQHLPKPPHPDPTLHRAGQAWSMSSKLHQLEMCIYAFPFITRFSLIVVAVTCCDCGLTITKDPTVSNPLNFRYFFAPG